VYLHYAALMRFAPAIEQDHLGGKLLYAGGVDARGTALTIAGNIVGAATLAATSDQTANKQAMRYGYVDFVVTTLDEALRILKNQVRKREPVSVCVGAAPVDVEREMLERGVEPDLLRASDYAPSSSFAKFVALGARTIELEPLAPDQSLFTVEIPAALTRDSAQIEEILAASIAESDLVNRRWLRLSPRYLGPGARRVRSVICDNATASLLMERLNS
jgi:Urocanase Rossmann-like domain